MNESEEIRVGQRGMFGSTPPFNRPCGEDQTPGRLIRFLSFLIQLGVLESGGACRWFLRFVICYVDTRLLSDLPNLKSGGTQKILVFPYYTSTGRPDIIKQSAFNRTKVAETMLVLRHPCQATR